MWGSADINKKVVIDSSNNTFTFSVDSNQYTLTIPNGTYRNIRDLYEDELIQAITKEANKQSIPVIFRYGGMHYDEVYEVLVIEHTDKNNQHVLDNFTGIANDTLFGNIIFNLAPRD